MLIVQTSAGEVHLNKPSGAGNLYHVMIGKSYHGSITLTSNGWRCYLGPLSELTLADMKLLLKKVEEAEGQAS